MKKLTTDEDVYMAFKGAAVAAALRAAIATGLLWTLAERPMGGDEVAHRLNIPGKRAHYWLQYLESFGTLDKLPQGYAPSEAVRRAILETRSRESWQHLVIDEQEKDAVVHGLPELIGAPGSLWAAQGLPEPISYVDRMRASPERAREFTRMLFEVHQELANEVAELLDLRGVERMMDLGGGSGVVSMALLRKNPGLRCTIVDIPNVCAAGEEIVAEQGFSERITFYPAEFEVDEFPSGFDLVLQCDVGELSAALLQKLKRSLKPGGRLIYVELFAPGENLASAYRVAWTFLDSLRDPEFGYPTVEAYKAELRRAGFGVKEESPVLGRGLVVVEAWKGG